MEKSEFQQHPFWDEINARLTFWREDDAAISEHLRFARDRAIAVGKYLLTLRRVGEAVPRLFSLQMLENVRTQWSQATVTYDTESYYANMHQGLDAVLELAGRWPTAAGGATSNARAVTAIYADAAAAAEKVVEAHRLARQEAEESLLAARAESELHAATVKTIEAELAEQQERASTLSQERQKEHLEEMKKWQADFNDWLNQQQKHYSGWAKEREKQHAETWTAAQTALDEIQKLRESVGNIVGATTSEQMSKSYKEEAAREFNLAAWSYAVGVAVLVGLAGFLIHTMSDLGPTGQSTWQYMSLKVGVSAALVTAATVAFRLGHKFLESSRSHKRMSMELVAMIPFLADLEEDESGSLRQAKLGFFDRSFGQQAAGSNRDGVTSQDGLVDVVSELGKTVAELGKRVNPN